MTYEERMKDFCLHCPQRCKEQACGYVMRNLERDCIYLQDVMTGWELGQQDIVDSMKAEIKSVELFSKSMGDNAINSSMRQFYDGMKESCTKLLLILETEY